MMQWQSETELIWWGWKLWDAAIFEDGQLLVAPSPQYARLWALIKVKSA